MVIWAQAPELTPLYPTASRLRVFWKRRKAKDHAYFYHYQIATVKYCFPSVGSPPPRPMRYNVAVFLLIYDKVEDGEACPQGFHSGLCTSHHGISFENTLLVIESKEI